MQELAVFLLLQSAAVNHNQLSEEINCLALNIYHEARGEPYEGRYAVGAVTLNRVESEHYPDTICAVVKQGPEWNGVPVRDQCQFSWWCDGKSDKPDYSSSEWKDNYKLAKKIVLSDNVDRLNGATNYHANYVEPYWAEDEEPIKVVGNHLFYRLY